MANTSLNSGVNKSRQKTLKAVLHYFYQDNSQSAAHCRYNLKYHLVWIPKYRKAILKGKIAIRTKEILYEIAKRYKFKIIALEVMPDHIHVLVEVPPKHSPSNIVKYFKGASSRKLRQEFPNEIKKHIWKANTLWAVGYYVASVGDGITTDVVREYIKNQKVEKDIENKCVQGTLFE